MHVRKTHHQHSNTKKLLPPRLSSTLGKIGPYVRGCVGIGSRFCYIDSGSAQPTEMLAEGRGEGGRGGALVVRGYTDRHYASRRGRNGRRGGGRRRRRGGGGRRWERREVREMRLLLGLRRAVEGGRRRARLGRGRGWGWCGGFGGCCCWGLNGVRVRVSVWGS